MASFAYCLKQHAEKLKKVGDPEVFKQVFEEKAAEHQKSGMTKREAELQAMADMIALENQRYDEIVDQIKTAMKQVKPGELYDYGFAAKNLPLLNKRMNDLHMMLFDSNSFATSGFYKYDKPIPKVGGIAAALHSRKYQTDKSYKKWVDAHVKNINEHLIEANRVRMALLSQSRPGMGNDVGYDPGIFRFDEPEKSKAMGEGVVGKGKRAGEFAVSDPLDAWVSEGEKAYNNPSYIGDVSVREGLQNSLDAVIEALQEGKIKKGRINIDVRDAGAMEMENIDDYRKLPTVNGYGGNLFIYEDNGLGMDEDTLVDKFLTLYNSGKRKMGRFGGYGIAKAVILTPKSGSNFEIYTRDNYVNSNMVRNKELISKTERMVSKAGGTRIIVKSGNNPETGQGQKITSWDSMKYVESTEVPKNIELRFNEKKVTNPFTRKKARKHQKKWTANSPSYRLTGTMPGADVYQVYETKMSAENAAKLLRDTGYTDVKVEEFIQYVELTANYYANPPEGYENKMVLRLVDPATGAKLTQGINAAGGEGFKGALVVDIDTNSVPTYNIYPLTKSRQSLKYSYGNQNAYDSFVKNIIEKYTIDKKSGEKVESKWFALNKRPGWKDIIAKIDSETPPETYVELVQYINEVYYEDWKDAKDRRDRKFGDPFNRPIQLEDDHIYKKGERIIPFSREPIIDKMTGKPIHGSLRSYDDMMNRWSPRGMAVMPLNQMSIKRDVGYKGYEGGTEFHANVLTMFDAAARMSAKMAGDVALDKVYPLLSKPDEKGGIVLAEYGNAEMGFNYAAIDKSVAKSPLALAMYVKGLVDHELTHYWWKKHDEDFSSARERTGNKTVGAFPYILRMAEIVTGKPAEITREVVQEVVKELETIKEIQVEKTVQKLVPYLFPNKQSELALEFKFREDVGSLNDDELFKPVKPTEGPRQTGLFGRTLAGIDARRAGPFDPPRPGGSPRVPDTPGDDRPGGRGFGSWYRVPEVPERTEARRKESEIGRQLNLFPKESVASQVLNGETPIFETTPDQFTKQELMALNDAFGFPVSGTKADLHVRLQELIDLRATLSEFANPELGVANVHNLKNTYDTEELKDMARRAKQSVSGPKIRIARGLTNWYLKTKRTGLQNIKRSFEEVGKKPPKMILDTLADLEKLQSSLVRSGGYFKGTHGISVVEAAAMVNPNFETGESVRVSDVIAKMKKALPDMATEQIVSEIRRSGNLPLKLGEPRKTVVFLRSTNSNKTGVTVDGKTYDLMAIRKPRKFKVADFNNKLDSPELINRATRIVTNADQAKNLGIAIAGKMIANGETMVTVENAIRKLKDRYTEQVNATAHDEAIKTLGVLNLLQYSKDFADAFMHDYKNLASDDAKPYKTGQQWFTDEIIQKVFFNEKQEQFTGRAQDLLFEKPEKYATRQAKRERKYPYRPQGVRMKDIESLFKGAHIGLSNDGSIWVRYPGKLGLQIRRVDSVSVDDVSFHVGYGRMNNDGEMVVGKYKDGVIELHRDLSGRWTLKHETVHWMEDAGIIEPMERNALKRHIQKLYEKGEIDVVNEDNIGGAEDRANWIADQLTRRDETRSYGNILQRIIRKIQDFLDGLVGLFKMSPYSTVRAIETGRIFKRTGPAYYRKYNPSTYMVSGYHGSPHFFNTFSSRFIGSGEGALAFGWGLYFTDEHGIAKGYADRLGEDVGITLKIKKGGIDFWKDGKVIDYSVYVYEPKFKRILEQEGKLSPAEIMGAATSLAQAQSMLIEDVLMDEGEMHEQFYTHGEAGVVAYVQDKVDSLIRNYQEQVDYYSAEGPAENNRRYINEIKRTIEWLESVRPESMDDIVYEKDKTHNIYHVNIHKGKKPSEYDYLEWYGTPSSGQAEKIIAQAERDGWAEEDIDDLRDALGVSEEYMDQPGDGQSIYNLIKDTLGIRQEIGGRVDRKKAASLFLLSAGIDGIKVPTGSLSGIDDSPHYNYVVFDDSEISVTQVERYSVVSAVDDTFTDSFDDRRERAEAQHLSQDMPKSAVSWWGTARRVWKKFREVGIGAKEDTTKWDRLLSLPTHYFLKDPQLKAMLEDGLERSDNYYHIFNQIDQRSVTSKDGEVRTESRLKFVDDFKKANKKEYARLRDEWLIKHDMDKVGFRVKRERDNKTGEITYTVMDPDGKVEATGFKNEKDALTRAIQGEAELASKAGFSDNAVQALIALREMSNNGFEILRKSINEIIKSHKKLGKELPKVAQYVDGVRVEIDLKRALAELGDMRGYYFPRIRRPGRFAVVAEKKDENPIREHFETRTMAAARAAKLEEQGYTSEVQKIEKMPEDVFQLAGQVTAFQAMMNQALDKVGTKMTKAGSKEFQRLVEKAQLELGKAIAESVADTFKSRGVRMHMIHRNDAIGKSVWKGYEEDPIQAYGKYARGLAAGEAKKIMALKMLQHFTGTDIPWKKYRDDMKQAGLKPDYMEYVKFVNNRRIDPIAQPNAFRDGMTFMEDMLRNDEAVDRFIGTVKGLAVMKYLAGRVSAPLVNLTAMVTSVPAAMHGIANIPFSKQPKLMAQALAQWRDFKGVAGGKPENLDKYTRAAFELLEDRGWHKAQYNKEALSVLKSKVGAGWDSVIEKLMLGFGFTEMTNRVTTIMSSFNGIKAMNKAEWDKANESQRVDLIEKWMDQAKLVSDRSHAIYGKVNRPFYARGKNIAARLAQAFYVFKTFSHNYLLTAKELGFDRGDWKAFSYMMAAPAVVAGAGASPMLVLLFQALQLAGADEPEEDLYKWAEREFGEPVSNLARLGIFGAGGYGISLKGSLAIGITDLPTSLKDFTGAPGSMAVDLYDGWNAITRGDIAKGFEKWSPNFIGSAIRGYREYTEGLTTSSNAPLFYGREQVRLDKIEAMFRMLSFNPARAAAIRERQWKERKVEQNYDDMRRDFYAKVKKYYLQPVQERDPGEWADLINEMREYNELVRRSGLVIPLITPKSIKNNIRRTFRPGRRERFRNELERS